MAGLARVVRPLWDARSYRGHAMVLEQRSPHYPPDVPRRRATAMTIGLLIEGGLTLAGVPVPPGTLFLVPPKSPRSAQIDRTRPYHDLIAGCDAGTFGLLRAMGAVADRPQRRPVAPAAADRFRRLAADLRRAKEYAEGVALLAQFLADLDRLPEEGDLAEALDIARRRLEALNAHRRPLAELLKVRGIGYDRLRRAFAEAEGVSPGQYRARHRVGRACDLLAAGLSVARVADRLGYPDAFALSRQFRRQTGVPPSRYVTPGGP